MCCTVQVHALWPALTPVQMSADSIQLPRKDPDCLVCKSLFMEWLLTIVTNVHGVIVEYWLAGENLRTASWAYPSASWYTISLTETSVVFMSGFCFELLWNICLKSGTVFLHVGSYSEIKILNQNCHIEKWGFVLRLGRVVLNLLWYILKLIGDVWWSSTASTISHRRFTAKFSALEIILVCSNDIILVQRKSGSRLPDCWWSKNVALPWHKRRRPGVTGDGSDEWYISEITSSTCVSVIIRAFVMVQECVANISTFALKFLYKQISINTYGVINRNHSVEQCVSVRM